MCQGYFKALVYTTGQCTFETSQALVVPTSDVLWVCASNETKHNTVAAGSTKRKGSISLQIKINEGQNERQKISVC